MGKMEKKMENTIIIGFRGYIGLYWGYIGIIEQKMETTVEGRKKTIVPLK